MKLKKPQIAFIVIIVCAFAFLLILNVYPSLSVQGEKTVEVKPLLYFNANSDLPNSMLYLKGKTINEIYVGQTYYLIFTITSLEKHPIIYTYVIESTVLGLIDDVTLQPGESKSVCIEFTPEESDKWKLDYNTALTMEHVIDLTNDSKIVELQEFEIEDNMKGNTTKVIGSFSWLFSSNISIDELRKEPRMNEHITEYNNEYKKTHTINLINISVIDDKLYLKARSKDIKYSSEKQLCSIKIFMPPSKDDENYIELEEIHFNYFIKMDKK